MFVRDIDNRWYDVSEEILKGKQVALERVRQRSGNIFVRATDNRWYEVTEADLKGKQVALERARELCIAERAEKRRKIDGLLKGLDRDEMTILLEDLTDQDNLMTRPSTPGPALIKKVRSAPQRLSTVSAVKRRKIGDLITGLDEDEMEVLLENLAAQDKIVTRPPFVRPGGIKLECSGGCPECHCPECGCPKGTDPDWNINVKIVDEQIRKVRTREIVKGNKG